jgi:hypothetical protein
VTSDCPGRIQYSAEGGIHGLACRKSRGNIGFKNYNIAFSPEFFHVLAANTAGHRGEVVFRSHFVFKLPCLHKSVFPVVWLDVR